MKSFIKPSARAKFGLAAAATGALAIGPVVALPANASTYFEVTNCNSAGPGSFSAAVNEANASPGDDYIGFSITSDCTVTVSNTIEIGESVSIYNGSYYEMTLTHDNALAGPMILIDEVELLSPAVEPESITTYVYITGLKFDSQDRSSSYPQLQVADSELSGSVVISNSAFYNAEAGAIENLDEGMSLQISNTMFADNDVTTRSGGAISTVSRTRIFSSYFTENDSTSSGGAIVTYSAELNVYQSTFTNNTAATKGGAIDLRTDVAPELVENYGYYYWSEYAARISATHFEGNSAGFGGAIRFSSEASGENLPRAFVTNVTFDDNSATNGEGGAISAAYMYVGVNGYSPYYRGGDYEIDQPSVRSLFVDNQATNGGAIFGYQTDLRISSTQFDGNSAQFLGGALGSYASSVNVYASTLYDNSTGSAGGAVWSQGSESFILRHSSVFNNSAGGVSGGVLAGGMSDLAVYGNTIYNNSATAYSQIMILAELETPSLFANNTIVDTLVSNASFVGYLMWASDAYMGGNIFASPYDRPLVENGATDAGANFFTSSLEKSANKPGAVSPNAVPSQIVPWEALALQTLTDYETWAGPNVFSRVIPIGSDSVAKDVFALSGEGENVMSLPSRYVPWSFFYDGRDGIRLNPETGEPLVGGALDAGAFEYGAERYLFDAEPTPIDPNIVITDVSKANIAAGGDTFSVYGRGLDDVTELYVAGVKVSFKVVSSTELLVTTGALPLGKAEILAIATDGRATFQLAVGVVEEASYWTKNLGNGQAKLYAKNIVGEGKVQFFLNGKEIAWINAIDESDPKLRKANGAAYLVRTVNLTSGKNRLEVKVDGVRVRFTTYSR